MGGGDMQKKKFQGVHVKKGAGGRGKKKKKKSWDGFLGGVLPVRKKGGTLFLGEETGILA